MKAIALTNWDKERPGRWSAIAGRMVRFPALAKSDGQRHECGNLSENRHEHVECTRIVEPQREHKYRRDRIQGT